MITQAERAALAALDFNPAPTADDVWRPSPYNVPQLHQKAVDQILTGVNKAQRDDVSTPLGVAVLGRAGSGKTHLLGAVREQIQRDGGYFFLVSLINGKTFWENTALCMVEGLGQNAIGWGTQLRAFLRRLSAELHLPPDVRDAVAGDLELTRDQLDLFIRALRTVHRDTGRDCQDTARALVLNGAMDFEAQDVGYAHLISEPGDPAGRARWGLTPAIRTPQQIVRDLSRLLALTLSPTVLAVDQIDTLFAQTTTAFFDRREGLEDQYASMAHQVADGLLTLRESTRRTLLVVSCLPDVWALLKKGAPSPVEQRFRDADLPDRINDRDIARAIIAKRFTAAYDAHHLRVPYPTWPIAEDAFTDAMMLTPRELIRRVDRHIRRCVEQDEIVELHRLVGDQSGQEEPKIKQEHEVHDLTSLDARFAQLLSDAEITGALDPKAEDEYVPVLLAAGLASWIDEHTPSGTTYKHDPLPGKKPALHGRLIQVVNEATENENHWAFRAIASPSAVAVISRVKAACTMAGIDPDIPQRRLILLRNGPWPTGPRTGEVVNAFRQAGGIVHQLSEQDLKTFAALRKMREDSPAHLHEWLLDRRPASRTRLFRDVLGDESGLTAEPETGPAHQTPGETDPVTDAPAGAGTGQMIQLGYVAERRTPFLLNLESLRRHSVIFAGSGSGKTVLIRRLIEESARQGVSAIVLDPNNDLARLGDPWPQPPAAWEPGDAERARDYLEHTDVVVWTPRVSSGRPLAFQPLPDFGPVRSSPDEFDQAIRSAVEALAPRAGVHTATKLAQQGKAVLTEALWAYAQNGGSGLRGFTEYLANLPGGVSRMVKASKLAQDLAETLKAAMVTDPLFGGDGTAADPGTLLTPPRGKRARVSVISFVGLSSEQQRQGFVNQLQMALFAWIKRHPAGNRPLGGLFVMDEAQTLAPSTGSTPCTASTIALASQARKYGLGLVFATQAPKGLHNQISGNATTQFFGLLNAPAQIDAARELAQAKGGRLPDIGLLGSGQFYAAGEGFSFVKVRTPLCLTYHPKAPLTPEEVVSRSRRGGA
jgi:hypothetical protein